MWEVARLQRQDRIDLHRTTEDWLSWVRTELPLREAPITSEIACAAGAAAGDPADAFLVATARVMDLTLVTADRRLLDLPAVATLPAS